MGRDIYKGQATQDLLKKIGQTSANFVDVVRFFKTFASIFVDRFPNPDGKAVIPGSYFYSVCTYGYSARL